MTIDFQADSEPGRAVSGSSSDVDIAQISTVQRRFGIQQISVDRQHHQLEMEMQTKGLCNPFSGQASVAPLAVLVDAACGTVNHMRFQGHSWTVSSELRIELAPTFDPDSVDLVTARAKSCGSSSQTALAMCSLHSGGRIVGSASVRSFAIPAGERRQLDESSQNGVTRPTAASFADLMSLSGRYVDPDAAVLTQSGNPSLNNAIGIVHGGVAAAGLELACASALNVGQDEPFRSVSIAVNFLRPLVTGEGVCTYAGSVLHRGRRTAVADASAMGYDGRTAAMCRVTAYR